MDSDENITDSLINVTDAFIAVQQSHSKISPLFYVSVSLIWIPGTFVNALALVFIIQDMKKATFPAIILLFLLCCCDLVAAMFSCARHMLLRYLDELTFPICASLGFIYSFFKISAGVVNCFMTVDRVLAICAPFHYKRYIDFKTWRICCLIGGVLIATYCTFPFFGLGAVMKMRRSGAISCSITSYQKQPIKRVYGTIFGFLGIAFILLIVVGNTFVIKTLIKLGQRVAAIQTMSEQSRTSDENSTRQFNTPFEIAVAKLMVCLAASYLLLGTPYNIQILLQQFNVKTDVYIISYIHLLGGLIYTVDPIVYILVRKTNRRRVAKLFFPCWWK